MLKLRKEYKDERNSKPNSTEYSSSGSVCDRKSPVYLWLSGLFFSRVSDESETINEIAETWKNFGNVVQIREAGLDTNRWHECKKNVGKGCKRTFFSLEQSR